MIGTFAIMKRSLLIYVGKLPIWKIVTKVKILLCTPNHDNKYLPNAPLMGRKPIHKENKMNNKLANRLNMMNAVVAVLESTTHKSVYEGNAPLAFEETADAFGGTITSLVAKLGAQQAVITGHAAQKAKEEADLELICSDIASALGEYFAFKGNLAKKDAVYKPLSAFQQMRDVALIANARLLLQELEAAIAADAVNTAKYGLDAADVTALTKELTEFEEVVADPTAAIAQRKALSMDLRPSFQEASRQLTTLDRLITRFRGTASGDAFIDVYKNARVIRDFGQAAAA